MQINKTRRIFEVILDILIFLAFLLIGADKISFKIWEMNIRAVSFIFPICFLILVFLRGYNFKYLKWFIPLGIAMVLSAIFSANKYQAFSYCLWYIYDVICITFVTVSYICVRGKKRAINLFLLASFFIVALLLAQYIVYSISGHTILGFNYQLHEGIYRPCLWFYEPSYFATFMGFIFAASAYMVAIYDSKKALGVAVATLVSLIICTSTTGFVGIAIVLLWLFLARIVKSIKMGRPVFSEIIIMIASALAVAGLIVIVFPKVWNLFVARIVTQDISISSGGRTDEYMTAFKIFLVSPIVGVGPRNYDFYSSNCPSNLTLELLSEVGVLGTFFFYYLLLRLVFKKNLSKEGKAAKFGLICFVIMLQANQNYLRMYLWMFIGIVLGLLLVEKSANREKKIYINGLFLTQKVTGIQRVAYEFLSRLPSEGGHKEYILLIPPGVKVPSDIKIKVRVIGHLFKRGRLWEQISLPLYMLFRINATLFNIGTEAPIMYPGHVMIHDLIFFEKNYSKGKWSLYNRFLVYMNINRYDGIITPSNFTKQRILQLFPYVDSDKISVCYPGHEHILNYGLKEISVPFEKFYLSVSSIAKNKNFEFIIQLAKILKKESFVIVGDKSKVKELFDYIPDNVYFTGYISNDELNYLFKKCYAFISPSKYEGFGTPPLEAIALGCRKIFISDMAVYKEVYGGSCVYFDYNDPQSLASKMGNVYSCNLDERKKVLQKCSWETFTSKILKVL